MNRIIILFFIFFSATPMLHSQCAFPKRVDIAKLSPSIPNSERDPDYNFAVYNSPYVENFHPIGWSPDGKAAYLVWGEHRSSCKFGVVVYDAMKDTLAGKWFENMDGTNLLDEKQVPAFWERDKDSIQPLLKKFHINCSDTINYVDFPIMKNNSTWSIEYTLAPAKDDNRFFEGMTATIVTPGDSVHINDPHIRALDIQPTGLWFSPNGKYALLIIYTETGLGNGVNAPHDFNYLAKGIRVPQ
ncbi:MAG: hypothetical protein HY064_11625 [Bacteroidetes bacterium]|nr:hypothetical protein [Bacteroidota bacterium]